MYTVSFTNQQPGQQPANPQQQPAQITDPHLQMKMIESNIAFQNALTRLNEVELYMKGLAEIRTALNYPSVKDGDSGLGERPPMQAIFDEKIDAPRLRERYFQLLDRYLRYTKMMSEVMKTETEEQAPQQP